MNEEILFKGFSDAYVKALEYLDSEKHELAKTQYLKMFELHSRLNNLGVKHLLEITNKNMRDVFTRLSVKSN